MSRTFKYGLVGLLVEIVFCKILLFPTTTPYYKLIAGFGVPVEDLDYEAVVLGNVFKARFRLPSSMRQLLTHSTLNIKGRRSVDGYIESNSTTIDDEIDDSTHLNETLPEDYANEINDEENRISGEEEHHTGSGYRWAIYKGLEALGDRMGLVGRACVLKSICEMAETPFHYHNGIYAEVLHIIFTPSSSVDKLSLHSDNEYFHAEALGKSGAPCDRVFKDCKRSLIDRFTDIYDITKGFFKNFTK